MDVRRLRIFVAVADTGSFTAAAPHLFLTQQGVSQQIALLEREFKIPLFVRGVRGVTLTPEGHKVASRARRILAEVDEFDSFVNTLGTGQQELHIGAFPSAGSELLPRAIRRFQETNPDISVRLTPVTPGEVALGLIESPIQVLLAFRYAVIADRPFDGLEWHPLINDPLVALMSTDHAFAGQSDVCLDNLAADRWIIRLHSEPYTDIYERIFAMAGFVPEVVFRADDFVTLQGLVSSGLGTAIAHRMSVSPIRNDVVAVPVSRPLAPRQVGALTRQGLRRGTVAHQFLETLRSVADVGESA